MLQQHLPECWKVNVVLDLEEVLSMSRTDPSLWAILSPLMVCAWLFLSVACSNVELEEGSLVLDVSSPPGGKTLLPGTSMVPDSYDFHGAGPGGSSFDKSCTSLPSGFSQSVSMNAELTLWSGSPIQVDLTPDPGFAGKASATKNNVLSGTFEFTEVNKPGGSVSIGTHLHSRERPVFGCLPARPGGGLLRRGPVGARGTTYHITATVYSAAGLENGYSNEVIFASK